MDRAGSSLSRVTPPLVRRGSSYVHRAVPEGARAGVVIGWNGGRVVGARESHGTYQYALERQDPVFVRATSLRFFSIRLWCSRNCSRVRDYLSLHRTVLIASENEVIGFQRGKGCIPTTETWFGVASSPFRSCAC